MSPYPLKTAINALNKHIKNICLNGALIIGSFFFALLLAEIIFFALNSFYPVKAPTIATFEGQPNQERLDFFQYHPVYGYAGIPNVKKQFLGNTITHNNKGLRGPELSFDKPAGVKRIAFIGDSQTWGWAVNDTDTIPEFTRRVINQELNANPVEVLNFGATGYGVDQSYLRLISEGLNYSPDIVVYTFFADNDVWESTEKEAWGVEKPYIYEKPSGQLCASNIPPRRANGWPSDSISHIVENQFDIKIEPIKFSVFTIDLSESNIAHYFKHRNLSGSLLGLFGGANGDPIAAIEKHIGCLEKESGPILANRSAKVRHTLKLILLTRDTVEENGGKFYVITKPLEQDYRNKSISTEYKSILNHLQKNDVQLIDLYAEGHKVSLKPDSMFIAAGHLSPQGNYLAARALSEKIIDVKVEPTLAGE